MKSVIILHGKPKKERFYNPGSPSSSNRHWLPWLQKQLVMADYLVDTPEMPRAYEPDYPLWKSLFERYRVDEDTVLIGHSCGGGFLLRWLSENRATPKRVILIAPWIDPTRETCPEFFAFTIDPRLCARTELHLWESDNDAENTMESGRRIRAALPDIHHRVFPGMGHFCIEDMGSEAFPELAELALL